MTYHTILKSKSERDLQRIIWKNSSDEQIKIYRLCNVTYGITSTPYLTMRCLKQLVDDNREEYPITASAIASLFYMNNILTGAEYIDNI